LAILTAGGVLDERNINENMRVESTDMVRELACDGEVMEPRRQEDIQDNIAFDTKKLSAEAFE
jgi:hypothetical protein